MPQKWRIWLRDDCAREERIKIAQCRRRRMSPLTYAGATPGRDLHLKRAITRYDPDGRCSVKAIELAE